MSCRGDSCDPNAVDSDFKEATIPGDNVAADLPMSSTPLIIGGMPLQPVGVAILCWSLQDFLGTAAGGAAVLSRGRVYCIGSMRSVTQFTYIYDVIGLYSVFGRKLTYLVHGWIRTWVRKSQWRCGSWASSFCIFQIPAGLQSNQMSGCVKDVKVNMEGVGIWNFVSYNGPIPGKSCS